MIHLVPVKPSLLVRLEVITGDIIINQSASPGTHIPTQVYHRGPDPSCLLQRTSSVILKTPLVIMTPSYLPRYFEPRHLLLSWLKEAPGTEVSH